MVCATGVVNRFITDADERNAVPHAGGAVSGGLPELRALLRQTQSVVRCLPTPGAEAAWAAADGRLEPAA
jgi:hypothetical protein